MEETLTILPYPCRLIPGNTSWHIRASPKKFVSNCRRTFSIGTDSTAPDLTVTGVVDEYADEPIPPFDLIDGRAHRVLVGHVEGQEFATTLFEGSHLHDTAGCGVDSP